MAITREKVGIGAAKCPHEQPVLHRATVDEQILMVGDATIVGGQADNAAQPRLAAFHIDADAVRRQLALGERGDPRQPILSALHVEDAAPVMFDDEGDVGARHREPLHDVEAGGIFAARTAQEFAPCRNPRKQILDEGVPVAKVARLYNDTLFPVSENDKRESNRKALKSTATKLRDLLADSNAIPKGLASTLGEALDELLSELSAEAKAA